MAEDAEVNCRSVAVRGVATCAIDRPSKLRGGRNLLNAIGQRACIVRSLRLGRSWWLHACWARCWRIFRLPGFWRDGLWRPRRISARTTIRLMRPRTAIAGQPRAIKSFWSRRPLLCLLNLWPLLLHECFLRGRRTGWRRIAPCSGAFTGAKRLGPGANGCESWPGGWRGRMAAHFWTGPAEPSAGADAVGPQRDRSDRFRLGGADSRRRLCK